MMASKLLSQCQLTMGMVILLNIHDAVLNLDTAEDACRYVILSTGPHWKDYSIEQYTLMVKNVLGYLRRTFRGKRVYIRSVAPGHPDCDDVQARKLAPFSEHL